MVLSLNNRIHIPLGQITQFLDISFSFHADSLVIIMAMPDNGDGVSLDGDAVESVVEDHGEQCSGNIVS